jgi:tRNA G37 N-methylase Trm5
MSNKIILDIAKQLLHMHIQKDDCIVDATMGRGFDTLFLAKHVHRVVSFDIQKEALECTRELLNLHQVRNVELILDSHEHICSYVKDFKGVIFNLGYLPKSDKSITTTADVTIRTFQNILNVLPIDGFILAVVYLGHEAGMNESIAIEKYLKTLNPKHYQVIRVEFPYHPSKPPYIILINKKDHTHM